MENKIKIMTYILGIMVYILFPVDLIHGPFDEIIIVLLAISSRKDMAERWLNKEEWPYKKLS